MGATYTRQSTYTDGDIIQASDTNDEFDQLLAAFAAGSGHTHDGTTGEGGPISTLAGHALTFGQGTAGTDIVITFDGETNDGTLKWMEDEDYFEFSDDILLASTEKVQFRDTAIFINSSTDGQLDIDADTEIEITAPTVDINASTAVTVSNDLKLDSDAAVLGFGADNDVTLTHVADTGLLLNSTMALQFNDASQFINAPSATVLDINATDEIELNATLIDVNGNLDVSGTLTVAGALDFGDANITNVGSIALDTITNDGTDITLDSSGDIILDAGGANVTIKDDGTSILDIANNSTDVELTVSTADKNFKIKGTDSSSAITALDIDMALAGKATFNGDVVVGGDLTISGDDLTMGTNTAGALLIADGTNFNPTLVTALSEISTVADDDVLLAVDTSGGGLKKITRSTIIAGTGVAGNISNIVEDSTPQLGGNLDTNSHNILIDDAHFIGDENGNEQIIFQTTSSAVNQFDVTNAATGNAPELSATGGDTNIDLKLTPKGTGQVVIDGNVGIESGVIDLKNAGSQSYIRFYCESSNAHYAQLQAPAHSAFGGNITLTLPATTDTLVGKTTTDTLTNKTLTSPVLNTATVGTSIVPASADGATLGSASAEFSDLFLADGAVISFGNDQEITLTHVADDGLILKHVGTGDGKEPSFSFHAGDNDIAADDVLGSIFFKAPDEGSGTDAILVAAGIEAVSEGDFSASNNATKLSFLTGASEAAAEKMSLSSAGLLTIADDLMIKDGGTIGVASTNDAITISSAGIVTFKDDILIKDGGTIGSASDADAITIASNGVVTFSQAVSGTSADFDGGVTIDNITIDGTEIDLSSGDLTVDVAGDIILDADGGDFKFQDDGTEILRITNSSSDVIIRPVVDAKDIIFQQRDGTEVARVEDNGTFNIVTDKLAINGTAVTSTAAELNILDGVTSTTAELNKLDGVTATTAELNYVDVSTLGLTEASKAVTADSNGVVSFDNGTIEESTSVSSSSGAATINLRDGNVFEHDLTENVTYTFSNPASSGRASAFILKVIQDSTARSITWPNSVDWAAATAPTLTTTNNGVDVFGFLTIDGGTTYYGFTLGQAMG